MNTIAENLMLGAGDKLDVHQTPPPRPPRHRLSVGLIAGFATALGALFATGVLPRLGRAEQLQREAMEPSTPLVTLKIAEPGAAITHLTLPSSIEPLRATPIYARVNGYLKSFAVDIGTRVQPGQVLAEIETPEIDQQLQQARATLAQTRANLALSQATFDRWGKLLQSKVVAAQEYDERKAQLDVSKADVAAAEANVQRLSRTQEFQKVVAPYSGFITERNTDVGSLIMGDNTGASVLFRIAQTDTFRVFVNVPQSHYRLITEGLPATFTFREFPGRSFVGKVARTAGSLNLTTRTLRTEVELANETGELLPGLYAEVKFSLPQPHPPVLVPSRSLIIQANGPQIATVNDNNAVALRSVSLGRDFGKQIEILTGLEPGKRFITNPTDTLRDGMLVRVDAAHPATSAFK